MEQRPRRSQSTKPQRVLVLDAQTPTPDRDSGSVSTDQLIHLLLNMGWHVAFAQRVGNYYRAICLGREAIENEIPIRVYIDDDVAAPSVHSKIATTYVLSVAMVLIPMSMPLRFR